MEYPKFKVCCRCFTFNHSKYITDTMNGFTMQQTSFPFVCTIVDDASTDGEQEVIRKYVEENFDFSESSVAYHKETDYAYITYAQHKTNKNCYFAVLYLKENHYSQRKDKMQYLEEWRGMCEYEALCEGDDYWIVPDKLEKQVEFLDEHEDYGLCFSSSQRLIQTDGEVKAVCLKEQDISFETLLKGNIIATLTTLFRTSLILQYQDNIDPSSKGWKMGDYPMWLFIAYQSKIHCIADNTATYRVIAGSASNQTSLEKYLEYIDSTYEIKYFFIDKYKLPDNVKNRFLSEHHYRKYGVLLKNKKYRRAFAELKSAPFNITLLIKRCIKIILNKE